MSIPKLAFLAYYTVLLAWGVTRALHFFVSDDLTPYGFEFPLYLMAHLLGVVLLLYLLATRTARSLFLVCVALACGILMARADPHLWSLERQRWFDKHQRELQAFSDDIIGYRHIWSMSDGRGWLNYLNGEHVAYTEAARDSVHSGQPRRPLLGAVLNRDSIAEVKYYEYRQRLRSLRLTHFARSDARIRFARNRSSGFIYVLPGQPTPHLGEDYGSGKIPRMFTARLDSAWYYAVW